MGLLNIRTYILDYLRGSFPWPAGPFKHTESNSFKHTVTTFKYTNWYFILPPGPRGLVTVYIYMCFQFPAKDFWNIQRCSHSDGEPRPCDRSDRCPQTMAVHGVGVWASSFSWLLVSNQSQNMFFRYQNSWISTSTSTIVGVYRLFFGDIFLVVGVTSSISIPKKIKDF